MHNHVRPAVPIYQKQDEEGPRWKVIPILEDLKKKARGEGLWNMFMPPSAHEDDEFRGAGLTNLEYAPLAEQMGHIGWASEVFNCSAPDTGNMEVLMRYGTKEHKKKWLRPLMDGEIRSAFLMTEPAVASSDATNIETSIKRDGDHYVINGRKWWSSGVGDPRCQVLIVMGKTDTSAPRHQQQSQVLVPRDAKGITVEKMVKRLSSRTAFGKKIIEYSIWEQRIAEARTDIEMNRLLCLKAADMMDKVGNKSAQLEIAMIKVAAPNMALKIIDNAIQAFGAAGVSDDAGLARDYASMRTMRLADGPDEVHNRAIARLELRKYANSPTTH
jgi:alkylation response protein AidB-like acyl-CoA dehydrogenase